MQTDGDPVGWESRRARAANGARFFRAQVLRSCSGSPGHAVLDFRHAPLASIALVFLTGLAWMGTIVTLLIARATARRRPLAEIRHVTHAEAHTTDGEAA